MTREEAIKLLNELYIRADITDEYGGMEDMQPYEEAVEMAIKALEQEPKWIPVDCDRYPEVYPQAYQEVWVTDGYGEVYHKAYDGTRSIKAWMPYITPVPYKAESEE